ncbi:adenylyltransferase/cytidyltransferase family protein [Epidermidibacterium keratini]|nr:adenylyltransferase/cytidyltransferase family protein [Epidermidibacterium keratini]
MSRPAGEMSLACVTGRFQPVHRQHVELFIRAAQEADHLIVAITNPDPGARHLAKQSAHRHLESANPFSYFERVQLLQAALIGVPVPSTIVPFDLSRPEHWHDYVPASAIQFVRAFSEWEREKANRLSDGGYRVTLIDGDPTSKISATDVRAAIAAGTSRADLLPPAVDDVLARLLQERAR